MERCEVNTGEPVIRPIHGGSARRSSAAVVLLAAMLVAGCERGTKPQEAAPAAEAPPPPPISWTHFEAPEPPAVSADLVAKGREVYQQNCASCHGERGDGKGRCAEFLLPHPRDFTSGTFRFKTTAGGELPTDQDLFRTVSLGLHGTGMPPWRYLISEDERWAVVEYVKTFAPAFNAHEARTPVTLGSEPGEVTQDRVARGKELYGDAGCPDCHGAQGYGDGPSADTLKDAFDNPIQPRNFHKAADFKRGHTLRDIALTISTGNNGTPMPQFGNVLEGDQLWDLAAYVESLAETKLAGGGTQAAATTGEHLGKPDVVVKLMERAWHYVPSEIHVRQGQIVRVDFQPTDNGLGAGHGFAIDGYDQRTFINGAMVQRPKSLTFMADKPGRFTFYCATQCSTGALHPNMKGTLVVEPSQNGERG
jgi:mono/diheme cytochrome c family protein